MNGQARGLAGGWSTLSLSFSLSHVPARVGYLEHRTPTFKVSRLHTPLFISLYCPLTIFKQGRLVEQHRIPNRTAFGECLGRHCGREARGPTTQCADANSWVFGWPLEDTACLPRAVRTDASVRRCSSTGPTLNAKREKSNLSGGQFSMSSDLCILDCQRLAFFY
jgi:hypothetical protein